jgi:hypothetical protein
MGIAVSFIIVYSSRDSISIVCCTKSPSATVVEIESKPVCVCDRESSMFFQITTKWEGLDANAPVAFDTEKLESTSSSDTILAFKGRTLKLK